MKPKNFMASHDGASSSSSSSVSSFTHDVFLSFRGPDTGNSFTAFLHKHLVKEGVDVYIDREDMRAGDEIKSALFKAIQRSKISIPVFSRGYADSRWCLDELVEIVRCRRDNRQIILPIFFDVDPRDVRHQTGSFKTSFDNHKDRFDEQTRNSWKEALKEAANLSGYDLGQVTGNQSKLVELVVDRVLSESSGKRLDDVKNSVGLDARVKEVEDRLCIGSDDIQFVGIWGPGGIGKTTIAKTLYNGIFKRFRRSCFLANIKGKEASGPEGLVCLQEQLIYSISKWKGDGNIWNVDRGRQLIIEKLEGENVLLILDDVDSHSQLNALAIESKWFGPASRIVITSRDKHILKLAAVDEEKIYCPNDLDDEQSLQLFSLHAFSTDRPPEEYLQSSIEVIHLAGGLPLTLEVLGSTFSDKDYRKEEVWKSMLQELNRIPHDDVYKKLKISYDNLNDDEKSIFLDVACHFVGWRKETAISFWDACGFNPILAIKKLTQRSLLKVTPSLFSSYDELTMHDQIQAMGRGIVYKESPTEPSKRSRLWSHEELLEAIEESEGAQMLEVILMEYGINHSLRHRRDFAMMSKLRLLDVYEEQSEGDFSDFPHLPLNLKWFIWNDLIVPANFYHKKLVHMDLSGSQIGEAWINKPHSENQRFQKLKVLNLKYCDVSHESLNFSWFPYLETLDLGRCRNMVNLHKSIGDLKSLVEFNLTETEIEELPNSICTLISLKVLTLKMCRSLKNLPESIGDLKSLVNLNMGWTKIEELPDSICSLSSLRVLTLQYCSSLKILPNSIGDLKALVELDLGHTKIEEIPSSIYKLSCLEVLILKWCSSLKNLPESIGDLISLVKLDLEKTEIEEIPSSICKLSCLKVLILRWCPSLKYLPESIGGLKSLVKLDLEETQIEEIPSGICKLNKLPDLNSSVELVLSDTKIKEVPDGVSFLEKLEELTVRNCHKLVKLPIPWGRMRCLRIIDLTGTRILLPQDDYPSVILLPSLVELRIGNKLESTLPHWISGLPQLRHLELWRYTKLESIPDLPSTLRSLVVSFCISLHTLPDLSSLKHLRSLRLAACEELKEIRGFEETESLNELEVFNCKTLTNTGRWKIHGQGTLLVDEMSRGIDNYPLNVNDRIYKGLIFCVVFEFFELQIPLNRFKGFNPSTDVSIRQLEEGQLVDISLSIDVSIHHRKHRRIRSRNKVVIEGVEYTRKQDIIYVHHFKRFDWFGIPLEPGIDPIEVLDVSTDEITSSKGKWMPIRCKVKFWKLLLESTASEQQQQITNQEEESITTTARRMVADFFKWSDDEDHGRSHHFVPTQQVGSRTHRTIHHFTSSSNALEIEGSNPVVPQQADEESSNEMIDSHNDLRLGFIDQGGGQASRVTEDPNLTNQEEESTTTTARRMVADFFNWSGDDEDDEDHGRSHHFIPTQQVGSSTHKTMHHFNSSSDALEIEGSNPVVPQQADFVNWSNRRGFCCFPWCCSD